MFVLKDDLTRSLNQQTTSHARFHPCRPVCRSQGEPIKAACAALMAQDVPAAVWALHLGHEPEQAAMLCIALRAAGLQQGLVDRVFEALALKCEAAGRWCILVV